MLDQVLEFFDIKADYDLNLMKPNQALVDISSDVLKGITTIIQQDFTPDYVVVQGDTTTAMAGALAAFYSKVQVIHIEAGLRSEDKYSPFPEEMNRVLIGRMTDLHFAPTENSKQNLIREGVHPASVFNVGNTVIDALLLGLSTIKKSESGTFSDYFNFLDKSKRLILVTGHRRENFGEPFENICYALKQIVDTHDDVEIVYPVHLNPNVQEPVQRILKDDPRIHLIEPLGYPYLIWLLDLCYLVITDSGGIQEEAPALGKPVLVMRDVTERQEGVEAGTAKLVGTNTQVIVQEATKLLNDQDHYHSMAKAVNPYGDGTTSQQVISELVLSYS
ncbi:UDP-N-acetylglucosamine 2-epimerase (non-hydrolyzing) [Nibribacter koreensis]|uniref:UDP-N-acetylglucosamine 2-epimerase (non-hydrolyzing) n=2 Tax=Nibribacter koreensis TaxID=1084519 RepID=A0ABP8F4R7_9BACT